MELEGYRKPENILSADQLKVYSSNVYPFNLPTLMEELKKKLKEDPNYEVWVPLVYCCYYTTMRMASSSIITLRKMFISNKGRVISTRGGTPRVLTWSDVDGYCSFNIKSETTYRCHRAVASSFLPLPDALGGIHPSRLQVNHLDGDRGNPDLMNLEWVTPTGNVEHAYANNLINKPSGWGDYRSKPVRGEIRLGPYAGFSFVLSGAKEYKTYGFDQSNISACCLGKKSIYKNCSWSFATEVEMTTLPKIIPDDVMIYLRGVRRSSSLASVEG